MKACGFIFACGRSAESQNTRHLCGKPFFRWQDTSSYDMTGSSYIITPAFILEKFQMWDRSVKVVLVDRISGIDIDSRTDFELIEYVMHRQQQKNVI